MLESGVDQAQDFGFVGEFGAMETVCGCGGDNWPKTFDGAVGTSDSSLYGFGVWEWAEGEYGFESAAIAIAVDVQADPRVCFGEGLDEAAGYNGLVVSCYVESGCDWGRFGFGVERVAGSRRKEKRECEGRLVLLLAAARSCFLGRGRFSRILSIRSSGTYRSLLVAGCRVGRSVDTGLVRGCYGPGARLRGPGWWREFCCGCRPRRCG